MVATTEQAREYTPTGDPEHVAYGADYTCTCTCGWSYPFITTESKIQWQAEHHEEHCTGTVTIDVI